MAITNIRRDWGEGPSLIRILSTDSLTDVASTGYLTEQAENIEILNNGPFTFIEKDVVLVYASDGVGFFKFDGDDFTTLLPAYPSTILPTEINHLAYFSTVDGTLASDPLLVRTSVGLDIGYAGVGINPNITWFSKNNLGNFQIYSTDNAADFSTILTNSRLSNDCTFSLPPSPDPAVTVCCNSTGGVANDTPKVRGYLAANTAVAPGTPLAIPFDQVTFDTHSVLQVGSGFQIDGPTGFYNVSASVPLQLEAADTNVVVSTSIYINGILYSYATNVYSFTVASPCTVGISDIVYLNGSNLVQIYIYHNGPAPRNILGGAASTFASISVLT